MRRTRRHARAILPSVALPVAFLLAAFPAVQAIYTATLQQAGETATDPFQVMGASCAYLLAVFVILIPVAVAYTAMQVAAVDAAAGRPVDMKRAWRFAVQPRVLGTVVLSGLAVGVSFLCCVLPGFIVRPLLSFATPVMAEEGLFGGAALSRSAALARYDPQGRFIAATPLFKVLALMLVGTLISWAVSFVVSLPFTAPVWFDTFRQIAAGQEPDPTAWLWLQVIGQFVSGLVSTAIYLYTSFGIVLLFFDARARKEGTDLAAAIEAMSRTPASPAPPPEPPFSGRPL
jgi:hypothetical protein